MLAFVDDFLRFVVACFIKQKSEAATKLSESKAFCEYQWSERLILFRSDNGTAFVNKNTSKICVRRGIMHQRTVAYSPQQNRVAGQMTCTIMEKARSMLRYKDVFIEW